MAINQTLKGQLRLGTIRTIQDAARAFNDLQKWLSGLVTVLLQEVIVANSVNSGAAVTLNLASASLLQVVLNHASPVITLSGMTPGFSYRLLLTQDATGRRTVTFSPALTGLPVLLSLAAGATDCLEILCISPTQLALVTLTLGV